MFAPLAGMKVALLAQYIPGPYCGQLLRQLGAAVSKIEPPGGDLLIESQPGIYSALNRQFDIRRLDLHDEAQRSEARDLFAGADVIIESLRPGKLAKFQLDPESVREINPGAIYCSISGFGQQGPRRDKVGHDITYLSWAGVLELPTDFEGRRARPSVPLADGAVALFALSSILAAYIERKATGRGHTLDLSIAETSLQLASLRAGWLADGVGEVSFPHLVPSSDYYATSDGRRVAISLHEDHFWRAFLAHLDGAPELDDARFATLQGRIAHGDELREMLIRLFASRDAGFWLTVAQDPNVPIELLQTVDEALNDEQSLVRRASTRCNGGRYLNFPALFDGERPATA